MNQERDLARTHIAPSAPTHDDDLAPGRGSRSSQMDAPTSPLVGGLLQRKARDGNSVADGAEATVASAASSAGSPLPEPIMRKFESSLGTDLSSVRVHTGSKSAEAASAVGAKAYTLGNDIHFAAGYYDPSSNSGQHLLAHEVAHTVQQHGGSPTRMNKLEVSLPTDASEHEADRAADAMIQRVPASVAAADGLSRRAISRDVDKSLNKTAAEASDASQADIEKSWHYGSNDLFDNEGELKSNRVGSNLGKRGDERTNAEINELLAELDRLKPLIERWKIVSAEVKAVAATGGINADTPDAYREGILAIAKARNHDGSTDSNDSHASTSLKQLWKGDELAQYQAAVADATGAGLELTNCQAELEAAKNRLQSATLDEEVKKDQAKVTAINTRVALIANTIATVMKIGVNATGFVAAQKIPFK